MASTFGSCSSDSCPLLTGFDATGWPELLRNIAARSARRVSACVTLMTSLWFKSWWAVRSVVPPLPPKTMFWHLTKNRYRKKLSACRCAFSPPTRFFVQRRLSEPAQSMDGSAISHHRIRREQRTRRLIHEGHKFVRKTRHRTSDANTTHVRTTANSRHPPALPHITLDHGAPAAQLHNAQR